HRPKLEPAEHRLDHGGTPVVADEALGLARRSPGGRSGRARAESELSRAAEVLDQALRAAGDGYGEGAAAVGRVRGRSVRRPVGPAADDELAYRPEADPGAGAQERGRVALEVPQRGRGAADELPPARGGPGVDRGERPGEPDGA